MYVCFIISDQIELDNFCWRIFLGGFLVLFEDNSKFCVCHSCILVSFLSHTISSSLHRALHPSLPSAGCLNIYISFSVVEAFNHYRGKDIDGDMGCGLLIEIGRLSDIFLFLLLFVQQSEFFDFLHLQLPCFPSLFLVSSMRCFQRVRGVWV